MEDLFAQDLQGWFPIRIKADGHGREFVVMREFSDTKEGAEENLKAADPAFNAEFPSHRICYTFISVTGMPSPYED